jgi:hypothetical protein
MEVSMKKNLPKIGKKSIMRMTGSLKIDATFIVL